MLKWIENNIEKTEFGTYSNALAEYSKIKQAIEIVTKENSELYEYLNNVIKIHGSKIYADVILDVELSYE